MLPPAVVTTPSNGNALANLANDPEFLAMGEFDRGESTLPAQKGGWFPTLNFWNSKHEDAKAALPGLATGSPYLKVDGEFHDAAGVAFLSLAELSYWCTIDESDNFKPKDHYVNPNTAADTDPKRNNAPRTVSSGFGVTIRGEKLKERILSMTLVFIGGECVLTLTDWRSATCNALRQHCDAIEATMTPEWAKANGPLVNMPPRYRLASVLRASAKGKGQKQYAVANSRASAISVAQIAAFQAWWTDDEDAEERAAISEAFAKKAAEIREDAKG